MKNCYTQDEVNIVPKYSEIESRRGIDLRTKFTKNTYLDIPIVSAPMDNITESDMAFGMMSMGGVGVIHRFMDIERQSQEVESRLVLDNEFKEFEKKFEGKDIPRPSHWGGICLIPSKVEIWKSRDDYLTRLHDRIVFSIDNVVLTKKRLYP